MSMNTSLVKSAPSGGFADVSALSNGWQPKLETLIRLNRPIKYDHYPLPNIPHEIQRLLEDHGYCDQTLEDDRWQHFFIPGLN
jgi:hypothetical protein